MANKDIRAYNQTAADLPLDNLGLTIPASNYIALTDYADSFAVLDDEQLYTYVATAQVLLWVNGSLLNQADSAKALDPPVAGKIRHDTDLDAVSPADHHDNSNDPSSDQKSALNGAGSISGANPLVSEGTLNTHVNDTGNPHSVTAAQAGAATTGDLSAHTGDTSNPHSTTAAQTGAVPVAEKGAANGVATLDGGSKIPVAQIPAVALPEVHVVANAAARLALTVQEGDEAIQTDDGSHWIYDGSTWYQRTGGSGDVAGPSSATDNAVVRFDGTTGKVIQNSGVTVDDSGNITVPGTVDGRDVAADGTAQDNHIASTANPHSVTKAQVGLSNVPNLKMNLTATADPTAADDVGDGYAVGSRWVNVTDDREWVCLDSTTGNAVWERTTGVTTPAQYFEAYDGAGGTALGTSWTDVPLDTERQEDAAFSHAGSSAEVEVLETDTYLVLTKVAAKVTNGTNRSEVDVRLALDTGSGYAAVQGTNGTIYLRQNYYGGVVTDPVILALSAGDKLKIQGQRVRGSSTCSTLAGGSKLVICRLRGQKGDQGPAGTGGLTFKDEGSTISGGPHTSLDVVGENAKVEDLGGGVAKLTIDTADNPETTLDDLEDFIVLDAAEWDTSVSGSGSSISAQDLPGGQVRLVSGPAANRNAWIGLRSLIFKLANNFDVTFRAYIEQVGSIYLEFGLQAGGGNDVYLSVWNTDNWYSWTRTGGGSWNSKDTGVAQTTGWHKFRVKSTGAAIEFYIDDVLVTTHTTGIPTVQMYCHSYLESTAAVSRAIRIDYIRMCSTRET